MNIKNTTPWTVYVYQFKSAALYDELTLAFSSLEEATDYAEIIGEYTGLYAEIARN